MQKKNEKELKKLQIVQDHVEVSRKVDDFLKSEEDHKTQMRMKNKNHLASMKEMLDAPNTMFAKTGAAVIKN